ncbi:MAG: hypothetical protein Q8Q40_13715 [Methylococcaceae bacterium]|nr:hypothetical protein [Methylococcaceae bacterium]MDP3905015.1 hypothetical protein [Methylococcaceae bacterium]
MQSIKIKAEVNEDHTMTAHLPDTIAAGEYEFILFYNEKNENKPVDLNKYSGTVDLPEDCLDWISTR